MQNTVPLAWDAGRGKRLEENHRCPRTAACPAIATLPNHAAPHIYTSPGRYDHCCYSCRRAIAPSAHSPAPSRQTTSHSTHRSFHLISSRSVSPILRSSKEPAGVAVAPPHPPLRALLEKWLRAPFSSSPPAAHATRSHLSPHLQSTSHPAPACPPSAPPLSAPLRSLRRSSEAGSAMRLNNTRNLKVCDRDYTTAPQPSELVFIATSVQRFSSREY